MSRYTYQLVGKGRWNSLTLKKPKPKGYGRKEPKMKHMQKAETGDSDEGYHISSRFESTGDGDKMDQVGSAYIISFTIIFIPHA